LTWRKYYNRDNNEFLNSVSKIESLIAIEYNTSHFIEFTKYSSWDEMHHTFYSNSTIEWEEEINISGDFYVATKANLNVKYGTNVNLWTLWDENITILPRT
jgi:hypothetical protein